MAATATAAAAMAAPLQPHTETKQIKQTKTLTSDLCRHFYTLGWVSGTRRSISLKVHDDSIPKSQQLIVMFPSGVQKERMVPDDMYVLSSNGVVLSSPSRKSYPHKAPKCTDCASLFMKIEAYPKVPAVLVHNHGGYIWGDSWISAKTQFGLDWSTSSHGTVRNVKEMQLPDRSMNRIMKLGAVNGNYAPEPSRRCILLDIEGTTTPISFVTDVLFPYARDNVRKHLTATYDTEETKDDIKLLRAQVEDDLKQGMIGAQPIPPDDAGKEEVIASLVANVEAMIRADRKITSLKQLQGHIWRTGFQSNELEGAVFEDVPEALEKWNTSGIKVYIYSSGSRESQRLIFGKSNYGDLRKYLCGFFDTTVGNKRETRSYLEISQSVGVDSPSEILFLTDVYQEAVAAKAAGLEVIISIRPGNGPLPENHGFKTIESFLEV